RGAPESDGDSRHRWPLAVAASVIVAFVAMSVLTGPDDAGPTTPSEEGEQMTTTYVSARNGFSVRYHDRGPGTVEPATEALDFAGDVDEAFDVVEVGESGALKVAS